MGFLVTASNADSQEIGGKARNLSKLTKMGMPVPKWTVVPAHVLLKQLEERDLDKDVLEKFKSLVVPEELKTELKEYFGGEYAQKRYAVRSSATDEDGLDHSYAGQFATFLNVKFEDIDISIVGVWRSVLNENVAKYRSEKNIETSYGIAVIIQEMVDAEVSGVAFGIDPVSGNSNTKIISAVYGLGEGLVSGDLDADTFRMNGKLIEKTIAVKCHQYKLKSDTSGLFKSEVEESLQQKDSLPEKDLRKLVEILDTLQTNLGGPQDIEFAYAHNELFLLQTRPVTASANQHNGEYILWDNSNIVESYPGITTPLTFSFIAKMYEQVYVQFVLLLGVNQRKVNAEKEVFENMLGLVRGRVYYNLLNWYKTLAMLPGYSINAEFMENMMGVKERFDLEDKQGMSKGKAWYRIARMLVKIVWLHIRLNKHRKTFKKHLDKTLAEFNVLPFEKMSSPEIVEQYIRFENTLLLKWKAPLVNDFFAMIWFGLLQKFTAKHFKDHPTIHNDLLCGSSDIISVLPVKQTLNIVEHIKKSDSLKAYILKTSSSEIWEGLETGKYPELKAMIDDYITTFGDRCIGELKLESISFHQDPTMYVKQLENYIKQNVSARIQENNIEEKLRSEAESKVNDVLRNNPIKRWWFNTLLSKTRDLVSNRENLRFERTRGFGMVRRMFSELGVKLKEEHVLDEARDIFYLELSEIKGLGVNPSINWKETISKRKAEFAEFKTQEPPMERFYSYGHNFSDSFIYSTEKLEVIEGDLEGIGCCPGIVEGRVRVVKDPTEIESINGDILVTTSTDPGWITIFPTASAILVERGSLLSHSAIVSREMGIPCIVSINGLLRTLKTGDLIQMDGSTGKIKIVKND
jgi:phosphohistidine swiveling domain-containing protein